MIKIGDSFLIEGNSHFEKCVVTKVDKNLVTLNNGIKFKSDTLVPLNSSMVISKFNEDYYDNLIKSREIHKKLQEFNNQIKDIALTSKQIQQVHKRLSKLLNIITGHA